MTLREINTSSKPAPEEKPKPPRLDQFKGCILGCALGDAIGAVVERKPAKTAKAYVTQCVETFDFSKVQKHHGGSLFGQYTDDTQLTRELTLSIVDEGGFVPEDFADRVCRMFDQNLIVGGGRATAAAAKRLKEGVSWRESGSPPPAAGNGAAMRAAPIGLLYWNDAKGLLQAATDQAIITHTAEMSVAGSMAIAMATAMCLNASKETSSPLEPGWWSWLSRFVWAHNAEFGSDIAALTKLVFDGRKKGRAPGSNAEAETVLAWLMEDDDPSWDGISPWARTSVLWSLYSLSAHPEDIWKAIAMAIWPGGDVDTTAAMTGALVGARVGIEKFPVQVLEEIAPQITDALSPEWNWTKLELLAEQLYGVVTGTPLAEPPQAEDPEQPSILDMFGAETDD